jgi:hypothetical protein
MTDDRRKMLEDLRDRLGKATGPDRELDATLARIAGIEFRSRRTLGGVNKGREWFVGSLGGIQEWSRHPPSYTASIDAAVTLCPPDTNWDLEVHTSEGIAATFYVGGCGDGMNIIEFGSTPALALCLACIEYELSQLPEET